MEIKVLDHGFVRLVDTMGEDSSVVQAARVSYGAGTKTLREDSALISYLMRNYHMSPFEMCELKFHMKLPIFVARQIIRHRTANVNEYSLRYSEAIKDFYVPDLEHVSGQSLTNKQSRGNEIGMDEKIYARQIIQRHSKKSLKEYEQLIDIGVAREIARSVIPVNFYTEWYWKIDLRNAFNFLKLRMDSHAQYETRQYANAVYEIAKSKFPVIIEAFTEFQKNAVSLSEFEVSQLASIMGPGWSVKLKEQMLDSPRECRILLEKLGVPNG